MRRILVLLAGLGIACGGPGETDVSRSGDAPAGALRPPSPATATGAAVPAGSPAAGPESSPLASPSGSQVPTSFRARVVSVDGSGRRITLQEVGGPPGAQPAAVAVEGEAVNMLATLKPGDGLMVTCRTPVSALGGPVQGLPDCAAVVALAAAPSASQ